MNPTTHKTSTPKSETSSLSIQHLSSSKKPLCAQSLFPLASPKSDTTSLEPSPSKGQEGPSPAKVSRGSRNSLDDFSKSMSTFQEDLDTKRKAGLYYLMVGDVQSAKEDLRRTSNAYFSQSSFVQQKLTTTENYNLHLHRENNDLRENVKTMKREIASKDAQAACHMFDDDFDGHENDDFTDKRSDKIVGHARIQDSVSDEEK